MEDHKRGKRGGNRGNDFRPSKGYAKVENIHLPTASRISTSTLCVDAAKYYECAEEVIETVADYVVPRRSLTTKLGLRIFPRTTEVEQITSKVRMMDGSTVTVTNPKTVWKSDRTLLRQNRPDQLDQMKLARVTSRTKRKVWEEPEQPATIEVPIDSPDSLDLDLND